MPPPSPPSGLCIHPSLCLRQGLCPVCGLTPGGQRAPELSEGFGFNWMVPNTAGTAWLAVAGSPASPRPSLTLCAQSSSVGAVGQGMQRPRGMGRHVPGGPGQGATSVPRPLRQGLDGQPMGPPAGGPCGEMAGCGTESQSLQGGRRPAAASCCQEGEGLGFQSSGSRRKSGFVPGVPKPEAPQPPRRHILGLNPARGPQLHPLYTG